MRTQYNNIYGRIVLVQSRENTLRLRHAINLQAPLVLIYSVDNLDLSGTYLLESSIRDEMYVNELQRR